MDNCQLFLFFFFFEKLFLSAFPDVYSLIFNAVLVLIHLTRLNINKYQSIKRNDYNNRSASFPEKTGRFNRVFFFVIWVEC